MDLGLQDVHVLITGASGGIGLTITHLFLKLGARVTAHYHTNPSPLSALLDQYGPTRLRALPADLTLEPAVSALFALAAPAPFGPVQVAVVNHAVYAARAVPLAQMGLAQWETTLRANTTSAFLVVREYLRALEGAPPGVREGAAVVLVGSTAGKMGEAGHADYAASKSAIMYGLCLSLKNEIVKIAPRGRVNVVAPGWVKTPMAEESLKDPDVVYAALATMPLKKVAMPEDVAHQIVVLSSQVASGHVSGHIMMVEGGMEGRLLNKPEDVGL